MKRIRWLGLALIGLVLFLPFVPLAIWSVAQGWYFPQVWPAQWSGQGWAAVFSASSKVGTGLVQSLGIATVVTSLAVVVGIPAGRALGLLEFPGKAAIKLIVLLPIVVSPLATLMGIQFVLIRLGLNGTLAGVILVHLLPSIPYTTLVLSSVFAQFDRGFEAQARSLGASPIQMLMQVTLPLVMPGIVVSGLFAFLISWNEFLLTFFVGSGRVFTLPMVLFTALQGGNNGLTAAVALTSVLPGVIFLAVTTRILGDESAALGGLGSL